jgi:DNA-binding MarR family transcriptional regulator
MDTSQEFTTVISQWAEVFMRRSMHEFLAFTRQSGISMTQLSALMRLYHGGGCGVSEMGLHLGVTNAAASQMIDKLVLLGLLERSEDPDDRRVKNIAISAKGRELIRKAVEARRSWMESLNTALTQDEQEAIIPALTCLTRAALAQEPRPARV